MPQVTCPTPYLCREYQNWGPSPTSGLGRSLISNLMHGAFEGLGTAGRPRLLQVKRRLPRKSRTLVQYQARKNDLTALHPCEAVQNQDWA